MELNIKAIKTEVFRREQSLFDFLVKSLSGLSLEGKVLAITSKIVSISEGRLVPRSEISKDDLVKKEADVYLCDGPFGARLTLNKGILILSAGIDESNSENGDYILYPENPFQSAEKIGRFLKKHFGLTNLGIILTDSHSMPLRKGVTGISLAHWGFAAVSSLVGQPDVFNEPLKFTHVDVADSLAVMAVFAMGEAADCTPLALISSSKVVFTENSSESEIRVEPQGDLYYPLLKPYLK